MRSTVEARQFFADELRLAADLRNPAVWRAFATVPRERFLGAGPWRVALPDLGLGATYQTTEDDDPRWVYHNVSIAIDESRHLVSGQPAALGRCLDALAVRAGERVVHLGSGVGYVSALLAELVGPDGSVLATEADPQLAGRARDNLAPYPCVTLHQQAGWPEGGGPADAILMSAGVSHMERMWLETLRDGGRLVVPLTVPTGPTLGTGLVLKVTRTGDDFGACVVTPTIVYSAVGLRDASMEPILGRALVTGALMKVRNVRSDSHAPEASCLLHRDGACLSARPFP